MRHLKLVLLALAVVGLTAPVAAAAPIEWHGGLFSLDLVSCSSCGDDQYMVRYTADFTNFNAEIGNQANWDLYIDAIAFKVGTAPIDATVHDWSAGSAVIWNPVVSTGWMSGSGLGCSSGGVSAICADASNVFPPPQPATRFTPGTSC
jgi:hypothetical protein